MNDTLVQRIATRDNYWDQVKGVLILLVVFGHVLEQCLVGKINTTTYSWIYTFHMPLFVFVSGYFTRVKDTKHYWNSILNLLGQFAVFQIILTLPLLMGGVIYELLIPKYILWYLWCLLIWRIVYFFIDKYKVNLWLLLGLSFVGSIVSGFAPLVTEFSFQRMFVFSPYFVLGLIAKKEGYAVKEQHSFLGKMLPLIVVSAAYIILFCLNNGVEWWFLGNNNYSTSTDLIHRLVNYPISIIMGLAILSMCRIREVATFVKAGKDSMFIMIYHAFIVRLILEVAIERFSIPISFPYCVVYTVIIVLIIKLLSRWTIFHRLLKPWTLFTKKKDI